MDEQLNRLAIELERLLASGGALPENIPPAALEEVGRLWLGQGKFHLARPLLLRAFQGQAGNPELAFLWGVAAHEGGMLEEAVHAYRTALSLAPAFPAALGNLGNALAALGDLERAERSYLLALEQAPDFALAAYNLGRLRVRRNQLQAALAAFDLAFAADPSLADAAYNGAHLCRSVGDIDGAEDRLLAALRLRPGNSNYLNNLGGVYKDQGRIGEAVTAYRQALAAAPGDTEIASNLILALEYDAHADPASRRAAREAFARLMPSSQGEIWTNRPESGRRLAVGFVSGDLREHPVARFLLPLLEHLDPREFSIHAYADFPEHFSDAMTGKLRARCDGWRQVTGVDDRTLAEMIRSDRIDVLIDLAGHTAGNRLSVFALKPAPVSCSWLGFLADTGVEAIDYRMVDGHVWPAHDGGGPGSERPLRLPHSQWCYTRPCEEVLEIRPLPAVATGSLTFGSFHNPAKLSEPVLQTWAELLAKLPGARLVLAGVPEGRARARITALMADCGVVADRLGWRPRLDFRAYLEEYGEIDIALDAWPYSGGTTACDGLWMGVPTLTLAGDRPVSRGGVSLMQTLELYDFVAQSPQEFIELGIKWANRLEQLAEIRRTLRFRMENSPLMDGKGFAEAWNRLIRGAWHDWCLNVRNHGGTNVLGK